MATSQNHVSKGFGRFRDISKCQKLFSVERVEIPTSQQDLGIKLGCSRTEVLVLR
jgi:hypothetical protein